MDKQAYEARFRELKSLVGKELAIYCLCAVADVPYQEKTEALDWADYLATIIEAGVDTSRGFAGGVKDVYVATRSDMSDEDRWEEVWGYGNPHEPYSPADYRRLDYLYRTYSARLAATGGLDETQEYTLRSVCTTQLLAEKSRDRGTKDGIEAYTKLSKNVQDLLSSENLRKKDQLPQEEQRIDGFVEALKRKYGVDASMTQEQAIAMCSKWLVGHRYPMTMDAADKMLLAVINCTRRNNDSAELTELPKRYSFGDQISEFADEPNEIEDDVYRYLELQRNDGKDTGD